MRELKASLAPSGEIILSVSLDMLVDLQALLDGFREVHESVPQSNKVTEPLLYPYVRWEAHFEWALEEAGVYLPNEKGQPTLDKNQTH